MSGNTSADMEDIVHARNMEFVASLAPTIFYLVALMTSGLVGNTIVFLVYYKKFKPSVTRTYILAMSVCDLLNNILALPSDIVEMRYYYDYEDDGSCKFFGYITRMLALYGVCLLVAIAVDRWRKICQPMKKQRQVKDVYIELICFGVFAALSSIPFGILRGLQTIDIKNTANLTGTTCSIDDYYIGGRFFSIYNYCNGLLFIICITIMIVAYSLIGRHIFLHKKRNALFKNKTSKKTSGDGRSEQDKKKTVPQIQVQTEPEPSSEDLGRLQDRSASNSTVTLIHVKTNKEGSRAGDSTLTQDSRSGGLLSPSPALGTRTKPDGQVVLTKSHLGDIKLGEMGPVIASSAEETDEDTIDTSTVGISTDDSITESSSSTRAVKVQQPKCKPTPKKKAVKTKKSSSAPKKIPGRTTLMMCVLTACFVVSYLPYLIMAAVFKGKDLSNEQFWLWNLHQISLRSFFINSAVNPLVYSFCSVRFRHECRRFLCRK